MKWKIVYGCVYTIGVIVDIDFSKCVVFEKTLHQMIEIGLRSFY